MFALIYLSQAKFTFREDQLKQLEAQATKNNEQLNVTGYLNYQKGHFLQYLEGNREVTLNLMQSIEQDGRHTMLRKVNLPEFEERRFPDWHMRYLKNHELTEIGIEQTLEEVLLHMNTSLYGEERVHRVVSRLIDSIANLHQKYSDVGPNSSNHPDTSKK